MDEIEDEETASTEYTPQTKKAKQEVVVVQQAAPSTAQLDYITKVDGSVIIRIG